MSGNSWLWIALVAFIIFCCLPMLFMRRHRRRSDESAKNEDKDMSK